MSELISCSAESAIKVSKRHALQRAGRGGGIKVYSGTTETPNLTEWASCLAEAILRIPNGADDKSLKPYLMYVTVSGAAKGFNWRISSPKARQSYMFDRMMAMPLWI